MSPYFISLFYFYLIYILYIYYISGLMVSMFETNVIECAFEPRSGQTENYNIGICWFSAKYAALTSKSKDSNPRSPSLETSTLPITPPMRLRKLESDLCEKCYYDTVIIKQQFI